MLASEGGGHAFCLASLDWSRMRNADPFRVPVAPWLPVTRKAPGWSSQHATTIYVRIHSEHGCNEYSVLNLSLIKWIIDKRVQGPDSLRQPYACDEDN